MLVVQDIFLTETAYLADVILPASAFPEKTGTFTNTDRSVQLGRQALALPGDARQDLAIIVDDGERSSGLDWRYAHPRDVFDEMRQAMPSIAGITWERLERESAVTYPCEQEGDPGERVVFTERFPDGAADARSSSPRQIIPAAEQPDTEYPFVLITGRQLEHWHTGSMTRRTEVLDAIEPVPVASMQLGRPRARSASRRAGSITVASRRGSVSLYARADDGTPRGSGVHPVLLLRGGGEPADESGARPVRQDPGVQVLRRAGRRGRHARADIRLRPAGDSLMSLRRHELRAVSATRAAVGL